MTILEGIIAFERYIFMCRKLKKNESLEQFHEKLVELAELVFETSFINPFGFSNRHDHTPRYAKPHL